MAAAVKAESLGSPPFSLLPGKPGSPYLHGLGIVGGSDRALLQTAPRLDSAMDAAGREVLVQLVDAGIHPQSQVDEPVEPRRQVQQVDLALNTVGQPMQEHIPLCLLVPLALRRQGPKLNRVIRHRRASLFQVG